MDGAAGNDIPSAVSSRIMGKKIHIFMIEVICHVNPKNAENSTRIQILVM